MKIQKSTGRNTSVLGSVIAAICIVIYLAALVQASIRIYFNIDQRKTTAEQEFEQIVKKALSAGTQGFLDDNFKQTMNDALFMSETIEALIITSAEDGYTIEKKKEYAIEYKNPPRLKSKISFFQPYIRPLDIPGTGRVEIKAAASAFDYAAFSVILKQTLLIILIGFAISFFTFLFKLLLGKQDKTKHIENTNPISAQNIDINTEPDISDKHIIKSKDKKNAVSESEKAIEPKGLYSPHSNIGWEEYTKDRLDSELHRCSSTEKDLVLIIMELTNIKDDDIFSQAAEEAVKFFLSRDLVFEHGSYGITIIMPGIGLNTGISKSEKFHQRINEKFNCDTRVGLSSRSGRLLNADRLMLETKEALNKAKKDSKTPIIAFKSDPEKYREFIRARG
ncbi:MAG: hypothetical protein FWD13_00370 [Treponema sp.]|nr:hypothetical protein [Treponema sp.]